MKKISATPYILNLRRARHIQVVLFGAFVCCYVAVLHYEHVVHWFMLHSLPVLSPLTLGLPAGIVAMGFYLIVSRLHHLPRSWSGEFRLCLFICLTTLFCILTSPTESSTLNLKMQRLASQGRYAEAVEVSSRYTHPTTDILRQRVICLHHQHSLCAEFFTYPYGTGFTPAQITTLVASVPASSRQRKSFECLLRRDLDALAHHLHDVPPDSLKQAEREALVLYNRQRQQPLFVYTDPSLEANYHDFSDMQHRLLTDSHDYSSTQVANFIYELYGNTYWFYYHYSHTPWTSTSTDATCSTSSPSQQNTANSSSSARAASEANLLASCSSSFPCSTSRPRWSTR